MPPQLPKKLLCRKAINHRIELVPRIKPLSQTPYQISPIKLAELRKELRELIDTRFIWPFKAPYGASILFFLKSRWKSSHVWITKHLIR